MLINNGVFNEDIKEWHQNPDTEKCVATSIFTSSVHTTKCASKSPWQAKVVFKWPQRTSLS